MTTGVVDGMKREGTCRGAEIEWFASQLRKQEAKSFAGCSPYETSH